MKEEPVYLADGYEDAFLGYIRDSNLRAVYDYEKCINVLIERDGMSDEEAIEFFEFNVIGAYVGPGTPAFLYPCSIDEFNEVVDE